MPSDDVHFNVKPSHRVREKFVRAYPIASFLGAASLGSKSKTFILPKEVYDANKEDLKQYGSKARR